MQLADILHSMRVDSNLSVNALASRSKVGRNRLTRFEAGQAVPQVDDLLRLLDVLRPSAEARREVLAQLEGLSR